MAGKDRCERYRELEELLRVMPELMAYDISLRPRSQSYRYCRACKMFFNNLDGEAPARCPLCGSKLRGPRRKTVRRYVDPERYGVEVLKVMAQTTLNGFLAEVRVDEGD